VSIEKVKKIVQEINGWLLEPEGELLYHLAKSCTGKGVIVEIGSWKGKSTIWLASGSKASRKIKVYAVDPHRGSSEHQKDGKVWTFDEFKANIKRAKVDDIVVPLIMTSEKAAHIIKEPVELVFVNGEHKYEIVKLDFKLWFPKLVWGGMMAFHDTTKCLGPKRVAIQFLYKSRNFRDIRLAGTITVGQKVRRNLMRDRVRNRYILLLNNMSQLADRLLPRPLEELGMKLGKLVQLRRCER